MKKVNMALWGIGLVALLAVAGCSDGTSGSPGIRDTSQQAQQTGPVKEVSIDAFNWGFNASQVSLKKGDRVRLTVTSSSGTHGVYFPSLGVSVSPVSPGQKKTVEFVVKESGPLRYFCNVPCGKGHSTMNGQLTVSG
ncbi:MAG: hypothetical protein GXP63_06765 [DPANN group archaeon]|nr:hypothetical protein [DPANN group archaeon]